MATKKVSLLLWMSTLLSLSRAEVFSVSVPNSVSAALGSSVILRCELSPSCDAKTLEVRWYRNQNYDNPILLYQNLKVQKNNRVSLIGELEKGNVSLKVENLTLADRGEYVCLVKSTEWYDEASVNLNITVVGSLPLLLLAESGEEVNATCVSDGWSPNPTLIWRGKRGNQLRKTVDHYTNPEGLVSMSSWVLFSPSESEWISCSVGLSNQEMKEGRVLAPKPAYKPDFVNDPDSTSEPGLSSGWKSFTILLVICLLVFTVMGMLPKIRGCILPKDPKPPSTEEQTHLVESSPPPYPASACIDSSTTDGATQNPVLLLLWMSTLLSLSRADKFTVLVPKLVLADRGSSVVLPCGLSPSYNAKTFEVRWYRNEDYNHPILFYENGEVQKKAGDPRYRGRVSLIGKLEEGNASLKLENLTLIDSGEYTCHVESTQWYDRANVTLIVQVLGAVPVLLFTHAGEQINVTCVSGGWSPKPTVIWRNKQGRELGMSTGHYKTDSEGLVSVSSWLLSSPSESEWISCSVGLTDQEMNEGRVLPPKLAYKPDPVDESDLTLEPELSPEWKAFTILLVISLLVFIVMAMLIIPKIRGRILPKDPKPASTEEQTSLVGESSPPPYPVSALREINMTEKATQTPVSEKSDKETNTEKEIPDWEKMLACKVAIRPVTPTAPFLEVGKKKDRVTSTSDIQDKTEFVHVLCEERIRSGRYYWEIKSLIEPTPHPIPGRLYQCPTSWYVGVTSKSAEKKRKVPLTPQNGYWVFQYDRDKGYYVIDSSLIPVLVRDRFSKLGVFIDCEKHTLSFYDCDKQIHLYTFYNVDSTSPLIPVLSPGDKQDHTITISQ